MNPASAHERLAGCEESVVKAVDIHRRDREASLGLHPEAASEGSFLGFGGVRVSDAEKATLDNIAKALGTTA